MRRTIGWIVVVLAGGVGVFMVIVMAVLLLGQETPAAIFGAVLAAFSLWIAVKNLRSLLGVSQRKGEPDLQSRPSLPDPDAEPPVRVIVQDRSPASGRAPAGKHKRGSRATYSPSGSRLAMPTTAGRSSTPVPLPSWMLRPPGSRQTVMTELSRWRWCAPMGRVGLKMSGPP